MLWNNQEESSNVEDRRGWGGTGIALGGGGGLIVLLIALFLGINPRNLPIPQNNTQAPQHAATRDPAEERLAHFAKVIFRDTETAWTDRFARMGRRYDMPTLVLYTGSVKSACGFAQAAVGPFYCPTDARVYLDLSFFQDMQSKLNSPGEFARAYVIAHEVGHHVQRLLGYATHARSNSDSVRTELQADFFAGVWAHDGQEKFKFLEAGDLDSAMNAAFQIGDDRLQQRSRGYVVPDSFTHGTSSQRMAAFREGFETGDLRLARKYFNEPMNAVGE